MLDYDIKIIIIHAKSNIDHLFIGFSRWGREAPRPEEEGGGGEESPGDRGEETARHRGEEAAARGGREEAPGYASGHEGVQQDRTQLHHSKEER